MRLKYLPNMITSLRILGTISLLFVEPLSMVFYVIYSLSGFTDVLDGWLARRLKVTSELGAKLDSIADLLFYFVMAIRIFPVMWAVLPRGIWIGVAVVVVIRISSYVLAAIKFHRFASLHTILNKMTGASVFAIPYIIETPAADVLCSIFCTIAGISSLEELFIHIRRKEYKANTSHS